MARTGKDQRTMRTIIEALVAAIHPYDAEEQEHIDATRRWLASGAPFIRTIPPDVPPQHLVSYVVLVDRSTEQLLLVDHRKARLWLPGGGHVEPDEHPRTAAGREFAEEFGQTAVFLYEDPLFLTITRTAGTAAGHTDVSLWYVFEGSSHAPITFDRGEFADVRWFAFDAVPWERTDPHMYRFVAKLRARLHTTS